MANKENNTKQSCSGARWVTLSVGSVACFMLASATRSNGSFHAIVWIIQYLTQILVLIARRHENENGGKCATLFRLVVLGMMLVGGVICILLPIVWHDWRGHWLHCQQGLNWYQEDDDPCHDDFFFLPSSFYAYVQRKHWNVGLFRYYQWKQIPNFLLAAPILYYSFSGITAWIRTSWKRHCQAKSISFSTITKWILGALEAAAITSNHSKKEETTRDPQDQNEDQELLGPLCLVHYLVLAMTTIVGLVVAHVQISTRLICSTCPAIYWYWASLCITNRNESKKILGFSPRHWLGLYCFGYIVLGCILHTNFLPWT